VIKSRDPENIYCQLNPPRRVRRQTLPEGHPALLLLLRYPCHHSEPYGA
jgi:hypothetical protein